MVIWKRSMLTCVLDAIYIQPLLKVGQKVAAQTCFQLESLL
jgi:hypothetical protein